MRLWLWLKGLFMNPTSPDPLRDRTRQLTRQADELAPGTSGEYKRHMVYSRLMKEFPQVEKRRLSLTIEQVLQERR